MVQSAARMLRFDGGRVCLGPAMQTGQVQQFTMTNGGPPDPQSPLASADCSSREPNPSVTTAPMQQTANPPDVGQATVIAVASAKGGVGKTSLTANLAGIAALAGWRVLAIDLDPQGNLATDLGYMRESDNGYELGETLRSAAPPRGLSQVRPGLDVWPGGQALSGGVRASLIPETDHPLASAIASTGTHYDLVFIDCPPALGSLVDAGLSAARWLLVPVRADHASLSGLEMMAARFRELKATSNPRLALLGVVLFDVSPQSTAIIREVSDEILVHLAGVAPLLNPPVRRSERSAFDMRRLGLLAHEYEELSLAAGAVPLAERIAAARRGESDARYSAAASGLAADYFEIAKQVLAKATASRRKRGPLAAGESQEPV
jgi:chromosome partitioning protein